MDNNDQELAQLNQQAAVLEKEKEISELKRQLIEEKLKTLAAQLPESKAEPPAGETTVDEKFGYVTQLVAQCALNHIGDEIGERLEKAKLPADAKILMINDVTFSEGDLPLLQLKQQFSIFERALLHQIEVNETLAGVGEKSFEGATEEAALEVLDVGAMLTVAPLVIGALADVVSYFKVDYKVSGQDFEVANEAAIASIAGKLAGFNVRMIGLNTIEESEIAKQFGDLLGKQQQLLSSKELLKTSIVKPATAIVSEKEQMLEEINAAMAEEGYEEKQGLKEQAQHLTEELDAAKSELKEAQAETAATDTVSHAFGEYVKAITTATDGDTLPVLQQAILRNHIQEQGITHLLYVKIVSSGGEAITKKSLWTSGQTAFVGGCALSYILAKCDGQIVIADTESAVLQLDYKFSSPAGTKITVIPLDRT